jgi:hypothetical protein
LDGATSTNLTKIIVWIVVEFRGMTKTDVANKFVYFKVDGVTIFQNLKNGVTTKLMQNHAPFMSGCIIWHTTQLWLSKL